MELFCDKIIFINLQSHVRVKIAMDALCIQFINSEFRDFRGRWIRDDLLQPGWLEQFLVKWQLQVEAPIDAATIAALVTLRTLLRSMLEALADGQISDEDQARFNAILLKIPLRRFLVKDAEEYRLEIVPLKKDWDWVQAEIAASFAHMLTAHDPRRLKVCANTFCRGVFYDDSKSRTKRYCTSDKCANLWKVRRFRARQKRDPS
jgi:predicted RNA-binding Zn ribbon-like protein